MARIILSGYMVRYPLGGMICNTLQWLHGLHQLGHDVYFVEKADYADACFDPTTGTVGNDGSHGFSTVEKLLQSHGLEGRLCFADFNNRYFGMSEDEVRGLFRSADLYIDYGNHGAWAAEADRIARRVFVDGEPGYRQIMLASRCAEGRRPMLTSYHHHYTVGQNIGTAASPAPTAGIAWHRVFHPVALSMFEPTPVPEDGPITTVMNWQSHRPLVHDGVAYGQKDVEFEKFLDLPRATGAPLEVAVAGNAVPAARLREAGWTIRTAHEVTASYASFLDYIGASCAEFSVGKNVFVALNTGWFSDRSAAYLACGRPVVLQDTGFSAHLPCGRGLFAVRDLAGASAAIDAIMSNPQGHGRAAREIAEAHFDAGKVLSELVDRCLASDHPSMTEAPRADIQEGV